MPLALAAFPAVTALSAIFSMPATSQDLVLEIRPTKSELVVGEPLVLVGTARSMTKASFHFPDSLHTLVDSGSGFVEIGRRLALASDESPLSVTDAPFAFEEVVVFDVRAGQAGSGGDWVFARPGTYRVAVEHSWRDTPRVRSNTAVVVVRAPHGEDAAVWAEIEHQPEARDYLSYQETPGAMPEVLATLVAQYPRSVYLQRARFQELVRWATWALDGCEPGTPRLCSLPAEERPAAMRRQIAALLPRAQALLSYPNPWAPEVLRVIARLHSAVGEGAERTATLRRLARDYPDRAAGKWAQWELEP